VQTCESLPVSDTRRSIRSTRMPAAAPWRLPERAWRLPVCCAENPQSQCPSIFIFTVYILTFCFLKYECLGKDIVVFAQDAMPVRLVGAPPEHDERVGLAKYRRTRFPICRGRIQVRSERRSMLVPGDKLSNFSALVHLLPRSLYMGPFQNLCLRGGQNCRSAGPSSERIATRGS
jgi:hypothetical protein